jgi:hypothetical protein
MKKKTAISIRTPHNYITGRSYLVQENISAEFFLSGHRRRKRLTLGAPTSFTVAGSKMGQLFGRLVA